VRKLLTNYILVGLFLSRKEPFTQFSCLFVHLFILYKFKNKAPEVATKVRVICLSLYWLIQQNVKYYNSIQKSFGFLLLFTSKCLLNQIKVVLKHIVAQTSASFLGWKLQENNLLITKGIYMLVGIGGGNFQPSCRNTRTRNSYISKFIFYYMIILILEE
jgi:hypothetical protein